MPPDDRRLLFLTGADGVGKTSLASRLEERLRRSGRPVERAWVRYQNYTSKPLLALARLAGLSYYEQHDGCRFGYHDFYKSRLMAGVFVLLQAIDVNIASYCKIVRRMNPNGILLCDRGPYDTLFDVMIDTGYYNLGRTLWERIYTRTVRRRCRVLLIDREYYSILRSRPALIHDRHLRTKLELLRAYAGAFRWPIICNDGTLEQAVDQIETQLGLQTGAL